MSLKELGESESVKTFDDGLTWIIHHKDEAVNEFVQEILAQKFTSEEGRLR